MYVIACHRQHASKTRSLLHADDVVVVAAAAAYDLLGCTEWQRMQCIWRQNGLNADWMKKTSTKNSESDKNRCWLFVGCFIQCRRCRRSSAVELKAKERSRAGVGVGGCSGRSW